MESGSGIGVIAACNLLYLGLRARLRTRFREGIRPGIVCRASDLATQRLIVELTHFDLSEQDVSALGRMQGPVLAQEIHRSLMSASVEEGAYMEEFRIALSERIRRFAATCATKFHAHNLRAARYEENFQAYRAWYLKFVEGAGKRNPVLGIMPDGTSVCDHLDADPLFDAFDDNRDPRQLGRQFADRVGAPIKDKTPDRLDAVLRQLVAVRVSFAEHNAIKNAIAVADRRGDQPAVLRHRS